MSNHPQQEPSSQDSPSPIGVLESFSMKMWPKLRPVLSLTVFFGALWFLTREFGSVEVTDVAASFRSLSIVAVAAAIFLTIVNYLVLIGSDWLAVRLVGQPVETKHVAIASLLSYAFSNSLGTLLGGTPIRFRLYSAWGLTSPQIVRLIFFIVFGYWLGLLSLAGSVLIATPLDIPAKFNLPFSNSRPFGWILLAAAVVVFCGCAFRRRPWHILGVDFQPPPLATGLAQATVSAIDFLLSAAVIFVLLPSDLDIEFFAFLAIFCLAIVAAVASNVPGGLGVFELVLVTLLPTSHSLVASLLMFRVIYYLIPLFVAAATVGVAELWSRRRQVASMASDGARWSGVITPRIVTGAVFVAGVFLLISGALPASDGRMNLIRQWLPLTVVEFSHFLGSLIGAALLVLARGLQRRIDAAWAVTIALLGAGVIVSILKGFDYEEATVLTFLLVALLPCRREFYRRGHLLSPSFDAGWIASIAMSFALIVWLIFFAYGHIEYSEEMWWRFAYSSDAPRSLRATVGAAIVLALILISRLVGPRRIEPEPPSESEVAAVRDIVSTSARTNANLALLGDKRFIFSDDCKAFIMFGCEGKSWIAMGDPFGPKDSADDVAWKFREECDQHGVWSVFYQVDESTLGRYVEMGLSLIKLGEEARVPLHTFSLEGSSRKDFRRTIKKANEAGLRFETIEQARVKELMPQLKAISDAWLGDKDAGEKGFSLGFFNEAYLSHFDIAMVFEADRPVAFANVLKGAGKKELSIDLMRYLPDSLPCVMEYLFIQLMLWGREQGFEWFNLGMAPLAGVDSHRLGPLWNRVSSLMFRYGEHFYNFQGLRNYKDKFDPEWSPKYLAFPGGLAAPQILANVSTLISGGVVRLFRQ